MRKINMDHNQPNRHQKTNEEHLQERLEKEDRPKEIGGPTGPEPTRYGDWEKRGRCIDF